VPQLRSDKPVADTVPDVPPAETAAAPEILVDPNVSRTKFDREVERYRRISSDCRKKGWWMLDAQFPNVLLAFVPPQVRPWPVAFAALINFDNYDLWAPSVRLVDPFTMQPLRRREIPPSLTFGRRLKTTVDVPGIGQIEGFEQPLLMDHGPDELPFFCIPGVREYHTHPAHTGDDWLLHRDRGEGTLYFIVEKLARYGLEPITAYEVRVGGIQLSGFVRKEAPE
jgi:hypothetical protein